MPRKSANPEKSQKELLQIARELQIMLGEINQKIDHLIERCRRFHLTDNLSHSPKSRFFC